MAEETKEDKEELIKLEMVKQEKVDVVCVLCGKEGHMGKDCLEEVCILCCAKGHLMDRCGDMEIMEVESNLSLEETSFTEQQVPGIRVKNFNELIEKKDVQANLEDSTPKSYNSRKDERNEEEKYHDLMMKMFSYITPPDVISLFKQKYCGLCCIKFSCEKFAWKHYNGPGHISLIRKKTYRNKPLFWQMVFHALISVEPEGASGDDIFNYILDTFSAHICSDTEQVRMEMDRTIKDMVERFHNVIYDEGVYRLRDRKPNEAPKPVPKGMIENKKFEGNLQETVAGFSNYNRRFSGKLNDGRRASREKDLMEEIVERRNGVKRSRSREVIKRDDREIKYRRHRRERSRSRSSRNVSSESSRRDRSRRNRDSSRSRQEDSHFDFSRENRRSSDRHRSKRSKYEERFDSTTCNSGSERNRSHKSPTSNSSSSRVLSPKQKPVVNVGPVACITPDPELPVVFPSNYLSSNPIYPHPTYIVPHPYLVIPQGTTTVPTPPTTPDL